MTQVMCSLQKQHMWTPGQLSRLRVPSQAQIRETTYPHFFTTGVWGFIPWAHTVRCVISTCLILLHTIAARHPSKLAPCAWLHVQERLYADSDAAVSQMHELTWSGASACELCWLLACKSGRRRCPALCLSASTSAIGNSAMIKAQPSTFSPALRVVLTNACSIHHLPLLHWQRQPCGCKLPWTSIEGTQHP